MQNFLEAVEAGYSKYKNPYHNLVHAADVLQTLYNILNNAGLMVIFSFVKIYNQKLVIIGLFSFKELVDKY